MINKEQYSCNVCARKFNTEEFKHSKSTDKCLLHCNKDNWFDIKNDIKNWEKSKDSITAFWDKIRTIIKNETKDEEYFRGASLDFTSTIFPSFEELYQHVEEYDEENFQIVDWHDNFSDIYIAQDNYQNHELSIRFNFRNSVFLDAADFTYYKFTDWVSFDNATFTGKCIFQNTIFNSVSFKNVNFMEDVIFENATLNFYTYQSQDFEGSTFHNKLEFYNSVIGKEDDKKEFDIDFKNTTFKKIYFTSCKFYKGVRFYKDTKAEELHIQNSNIEYLYIASNTPLIALQGNGKTIKKLIIKHNNLERLIIHNTIIKEDFLLNDKQYRQNDTFKLSLLHLKESKFEKKVKIQFYDIEKADFYNTKFEDLADFYQTKFSNVNFERTDFKDISVFSETEFLCDVDFKYTKFLSKAIFRDTLITGTLNLRDSIFDDEATFLDITSKSRKIFDKEKNEYIFMGEPADIKVKNRETARIIKNFYDNSNNIIEANRFYKLEMLEKEKELSKDIKSHFLEWLVFKVHAISSNHSQNWFLSLFWILSFTLGYSHAESFMQQPRGELYLLPFLATVTILLYSLLKISTFNKLSNIELFGLTISLYFTYNITVNDYNLYCFSNNLNPFSIMTGYDELDIFGLIYKVFIAYLLYQLIISIRQNTRRK